MDEDIKKIKIKDLPVSTDLGNDDIFIKSNTIETHKIDADSIAKYISENKHLTQKFLNKTSVGSTDGLVPLNSNSKIDGTYITYGKTINTSYEGSNGKILEENLDQHLLDENAHGYNESINDIKALITELTNKLDSCINSINLLNSKIDNFNRITESQIDTLFQ